MELDGLSLEVDGTDLEVDTDGRDVALGVGVVGESQEETRLANTRVTDQEELLSVSRVLGAIWSAWCRGGSVLMS